MKSRVTSVAGGSVKQWLGASALVMAGLALTPVGVAMATEASQQQTGTLFDFDLPAEPLPRALNDFSRLTGLSVVYTDEAPYGLQAPAIKGRMHAEQALQQMLAHSGFNARRTDPRTFALEPQPTAGALNLGATSITSQTSIDTRRHRLSAASHHFGDARYWLVDGNAADHQRGRRPGDSRSGPP